MTHQEFIDELARRGVRTPARPADDLDTISRRDFGELVPDLLNLQLKRTTRAKAHPLAVAAYDQRISIEELATRAGTSVTSSDFGNLMAESFGLLMQSTFAGATADIERVCSDFDAANYRPVTIGHASFAAPIEVREDTGLEKLEFRVTESERNGSLREFGGTFSFSRRVWSVFGDQLPAMVRRHAAQTFPSIERQLLAACLESATCASTVAAFDAGGLNTALAALRNQETAASQKLNLELATIVIPPALEASARILRASMEWPTLGIVINPYLSVSTTWFAVCDPRWSSPVLRLRLRDTRGPSVFFGFSFEGNPRFAISYSVDFVHAAVPGLLKCTAS